MTSAARVRSSPCEIEATSAVEQIPLAAKNHGRDRGPTTICASGGKKGVAPPPEADRISANWFAPSAAAALSHESVSTVRSAPRHRDVLLWRAAVTCDVKTPECSASCWAKQRGFGIPLARSLEGGTTHEMDPIRRCGVGRFRFARVG